MYRLLIVDDEPDIADGLYMMLSQAAHLDLDLYKAYSAYEAMEWLNRTQIDIVMSDIQMPGMTGMQLAENIKLRWPRCRIVFVTGYNSFDFAYSAIRQGVDGYILKTDGFEQITALIERTVEKIKQDHQMADLLSASQAGMKVILPLMQREFWTDLLHGEPLDADERRTKFAELDIAMNPEQPVQLVVGQIGQLPKAQTALEKLQMGYVLHFLAGQCISQQLLRMESVCERAFLVWFIQSVSASDPAADAEQHAQYMRGTLESYQKLCLESLQLPISFMVDTAATAWEDVPRRYGELRSALYAEAGSGMEIRLMRAERNLADTGKLLQMRHKWLTTLEASLESGHREECHRLLGRMTEGLEQERIGASSHSLELHSALNLLFLSYVNRRQLRERLANTNSNTNSNAFELDKLITTEPHKLWNHARDYYAKLVDALFELRQADEENRTISAINKTRQYILEHLGDDLSLVTLAERVYFNPSYLSRLFKQTTGTNLLAFINEARLAKAKELLGDSRMKIFEIAAAIGCVSPAYFTQFFKKAFHMSPQEYRELHFKQVKKP